LAYKGHFGHQLISDELSFLDSLAPMNSSNVASPQVQDRPPAPREGQVFVDCDGGLWKVKRLTLAESPPGFYLVHLCHGSSLDALKDSMILGPREFAALLRERDLKVQLRAV
jgi:hypothetical protein